MNKARITYRLTQNLGGSERLSKNDGHGESEREEQKAAKIISLNRDEYHIEADAKQTAHTSELFDRDPLNPFTTDFGAWKSPFSAESEADRVERIIRESAGSDGETGYYGSRHNGVHDQENVREFFTPSSDHARPPRYLRTTRPPWLKMISSVAGAIATGALFGFFVLSLFSGDHPSIQSTAADLLKLPSFSVVEKIKSGAALPAGESEGAAKSQRTAVNSTSKAQEANDIVQGRAAASVAANVSGSLQVNIPAKTYTMIQNGVFSSLQGAQSMQSELKKKGFPSVTESGEKIYVYMGIAANRSDALALGQKLQQNKMEAYMKSYTLPAVGKIIWNGPPSSAAETYIAQGDKLVKELSGFTLANLQESASASTSRSIIKSLKEAHRSFSAAGASFQDGIPNEAKTILQKMNNAMNTAVLSVEQYDKNASAAYLWQAQQSLLQYALAEKELLSAISGP